MESHGSHYIDCDELSALLRMSAECVKAEEESALDALCHTMLRLGKRQEDCIVMTYDALHFNVNWTARYKSIHGQLDAFLSRGMGTLIYDSRFRVVCLEVPREKVSLRDFFHMGSRASSPSEIKYRLSIEHLRDKLLRLRDLGCLKHCLEIDTRDFNKLEFLGDTVLQYEATIRIWQSYGCFHGADGLTNKRSDTVRNLTLACVFEDLGFDKDWMRKPPDKWDRASWKPMADALEAIIGELHVLSMSPGVELSAEIPLARECISSIVEACRDRGERLRDPSEISSILISVTHLNSKTT